MSNNSPSASRGQENREDAPPGWPELQDGLANSFGLSMLLVSGPQPPALVVSNNNSICAAFQSSPQHRKRCDPFCGDAHRKATQANDTVEYKCHAGLLCFAKPVQIENRALAIIGGRAFVNGADYQQLVERYRSGELKELESPSFFSNTIFAERHRLRDLSERVEKGVSRFSSEPRAAANLLVHANGASVPKAESLVRVEAAPLPDRTLELEIERLRGELEHSSRFTDTLQRFLQRISSEDPTKTYYSIISNSRELLDSERASLMVFDEPANKLVLKAAIGMSVDPAAVGHMRVGEGVSGSVIESGKALIIDDVDSSEITPAPAERRYKTKSFISFPITIGGRKIGVLNIADKLGGRSYDKVDLSLLEIIGPQVALALEKAEWQERANAYQLMSITDPLTGLPNRRYLEERLTEEVNRSKRSEFPMCFLMIDIDDFKAYNDNNGHQAGDLALQITAHCLKGALRAADVASRYGGEEFCILLPQTTASEAAVIADRIRQRVATTHFPHGKSQPHGHVTISIGVSSFSSIVNSAETVIAAADRALYQAKSLGKDRIEFYKDGSEGASANES
ncbi:MAG TPA: diguanylate cyclase [Pyrinomonadaceae bacterium]|nr:diguanylate cyclase [Pyrinomonadaceae bacterium]